MRITVQFKQCNYGHVSYILSFCFRTSSGKTSLLFQFAINRALESSSKVVFICDTIKCEYHHHGAGAGIATTTPPATRR